MLFLLAVLGLAFAFLNFAFALLSFTFGFCFGVISRFARRFFGFTGGFVACAFCFILCTRCHDNTSNPLVGKMPRVKVRGALQSHVGTPSD